MCLVRCAVCGNASERLGLAGGVDHQGAASEQGRGAEFRPSCGQESSGATSFRSHALCGFARIIVRFCRLLLLLSAAKRGDVPKPHAAHLAASAEEEAKRAQVDVRMRKITCFNGPCHTSSVIAVCAMPCCLCFDCCSSPRTRRRSMADRSPAGARDADAAVLEV